MASHTISLGTYPHSGALEKSGSKTALLAMLRDSDLPKMDVEFETVYTPGSGVQLLATLEWQTKTDRENEIITRRIEAIAKPIIKK